MSIPDFILAKPVSPELNCILEALERALSSEYHSIRDLKGLHDAVLDEFLDPLDKRYSMLRQ